MILLMTFMSFAYLRQSEDETSASFSERFRTFEDMMAEILDTLFELSYFLGERDPGNEDGFHYFARERFAQAPYTARSAWILVRGGFYPDAAVLIRHFLETFAQLRYFSTHPEKLLPHYLDMSRRDRVTFRTIFEELATGYYDKHYRLLASVSHAGAGLSALSGMEQMTDGTGRMLSPAGCRFDEDRSSFIVNHMLMLMSGFLRFVSTWFPKYVTLTKAQTEERRALALAALEEWRKAHRAKFPHTDEWHKKSAALVGAP